MTGWIDTLGAKTPEEAARRRFGLWSLIVFVLILPPWWLWGADLMLAALKPFTGLIFSMTGLSSDIAVGQGGEWIIGTPLTRAGVPVSHEVVQASLRRLMLGFPLAFAFLSAPPRTLRLIGAAVITMLVLSALFVVSLTCLIWGDLASQLNPALAPASAGAVAGLDQPALHPLMAQIAIIGRYIGMSVAPLVAAILLWASLNPAGRSMVMADDSLKSEAEAEG